MNMPAVIAAIAYPLVYAVAVHERLPISDWLTARWHRHQTPWPPTATPTAPVRRCSRTMGAGVCSQRKPLMRFQNFTPQISTAYRPPKFPQLLAQPAQPSMAFMC